MADRFPLILNTSANQIQEIGSGDQLNLSGNNIANAGIITAGNVTIGAATTDLVVTGDARITGILTVGTSSLKLDGPNNLVNVGTALTLGHSQGLQFHTQNLHSAGFEVNQINASGIITATTFSGSGASLTGITNANISNSASIVGTKIANASINADDKLENSSITESKLGSGVVSSSKIANGTIVNEDINASAAIAGTKISPNFGAQNILTTGQLQISGALPTILLNDENNENDFELRNQNGSFIIRDIDNPQTRYTIASSGMIHTFHGAASFSSNLDVGAGIDVTGNSTFVNDIDVDGHTNLDNVSVAGVVTATGSGNFGSNLNITGTSPFIDLVDSNSNSDYKFHNDDGTFKIKDMSNSNAVRYQLGADGKHYIYGDTTVMGSSNLTVGGNLSVGGVLTYEDVTNVDSVGIVTARQGIEIKNDTYKLRTGAQLEMQVFHDGTNSIIKDTRDSGKVRIQADNFDIIDKDASTTVFSAAPGGISSPKLHTFSAGATVSGGTLYVGSTTFGSSLGQVRIINDASSTPASLSLFGFGNTTTGDVFAKIDFASQENGTAGQVTAGIEAQAVGVAERAADLVFKTRPDTNGSSAASRFRIRSTGMVGVGVDDPAVAGGYHGMEIGGTANSGLRLSVTSNGGWAFTDYEINGTQAYIVGCKGGTDSLSPASSWRICSGASFDANQLFVVNANGSVLPGSDNTQDFGSSSFRWANIYTGDLNLSNEGTVNDVDGTWGNFQIQEGENDLFLINKRNGKKYKFNLTEV